MSMARPPPPGMVPDGATREASGCSICSCSRVGRTSIGARVWMFSTAADGSSRVARAEALAQARTPATPALAIRKAPVMATIWFLSMTISFVRALPVREGKNQSPAFVGQRMRARVETRFLDDVHGLAVHDVHAALRAGGEFRIVGHHHDGGALAVDVF